MDNISFKLKKYSEYLINEYDEIKCNDGGRVMSDLKQFYEEGKIKDLIFKNTSYTTKTIILNLFKDKILLFSKSRNINLNLMSFEEWSTNNSE